MPDRMARLRAKALAAQERERLAMSEYQADRRVSNHAAWSRARSDLRDAAVEALPDLLEASAQVRPPRVDELLRSNNELLARARVGGQLQDLQDRMRDSEVRGRLPPLDALEAAVHGLIERYGDRPDLRKADLRKADLRKADLARALMAVLHAASACGLSVSDLTDEAFAAHALDARVGDLAEERGPDAPEVPERLGDPRAPH